jgi:hypothetical protein
MRICPVCRRALRINDPSISLTIPEDNRHGVQPGHYGSVCADCGAEYEPNGPSVHYVGLINNPAAVSGDEPPASYPGGMSDSPNGLKEAPAWYCSTCRRFAREDDTMETIRLYPEDLGPEDLHLLPNAVCGRFHGGHCVYCDWQGAYEERCPQCWQTERLTDLPHHFPRTHTRRDCDWAGPWQEQCPQCGTVTLRQPEAYYSCGECRKRFAPAILRRLAKTNPQMALLRPEQLAPFMMA